MQNLRIRPVSTDEFKALDRSASIRQELLERMGELANRRDALTLTLQRQIGARALLQLKRGRSLDEVTTDAGMFTRSRPTFLELNEVASQLHATHLQLETFKRSS